MLKLPPVLMGVLGRDPAKKTLLVYGHLDVQPAAIEDGWDTEPFVMTEKVGNGVPLLLLSVVSCPLSAACGLLPALLLLSTGPSTATVAELWSLRWRERDHGETRAGRDPRTTEPLSGTAVRPSAR